jgi:micrococcal nuclease
MRFIILFFAAFLTTGIFSQQRYPVTVTKISDGDTFWAQDASGQNIKFRPIGFDAPEESNFGKPAEPYNEEATVYLMSLIKDKILFVEYDVDQQDRWGRHLVYVYLEDGTFVNAEMLRSGWAVAATYPPNIKHSELFYQMQREAREKGRGMWGKAIK